MNYESLSNTFDNLIKSCLTIIKILLLSKFGNQVKKIQNVKSECIVLGNGPSLNSSIKKFPKNVNINFDILCVNYFVTSALYELIRPSLYVVSAPEMWLNNIEERYIFKRDELFDDLIKKTQWDLKLFAPCAAKKSVLFRNLQKKNPKINIIYYNNTPIEGFKKLNHFFFKIFLGIPRPHNVIIPSLMIAIQLKYKNVFLFGAEHSWLKEIDVTDKNVVLINQKHFYDEKNSTAKPMAKIGKGTRKLHEVLEKLMFSFKSYFEINEYALTKNINIYNSTPKSYIDAFKRQNPFKQKIENEF